jgi:hypothetical protein
LEERYEDVEEAVRCANGDDNVEDERLPALGEDAEEEQPEGDLEEGCGEDVEYFGELD